MRSNHRFSTLIGLAALASVGATPVVAQCATPGVDVIVSEVGGATNYAVSGAYDALSLGVTFCNLGTQSADWQGATALHPVLGQALYRHRVVAGASRFEQIGLSWLHHQSTALNAALCCTCTPGSLSSLGAGCSTTSTASAVGTQGNMGPRHEADPQTGAFVWPSSDPPYAGSVARRLRFAVADANLAEPGLAWFAELHVVEPGESATERDDNASHRALTCVPGANPSFMTQGATTAQQPAIFAWQTLDAGVSYVETSALGGRVIVAQRASAIEPGWWHYEFVVHNQNATDAVRSFQVPIGSGTAVRNAGFHDVEHHSGDGLGDVDQDGTDWNVTLGDGRIAWTTDAFATNPNANALRWGTTYNFRFDASAAPSAGLAELERFVPGVPATATLAVMSAGSAAVGLVLCEGSGGAVPCPCANASTPGAGEGCLNSFATGGRLAAGGIAQLGSDTLVLAASGMPNSTALFFQGTTAIAGGVGAPFGDGLRCAGGSSVRLGTKLNAGGASSYPGPGDPSVSVKGLVTGPGSRVYQVWYRNAAAFCTASTFNLTNGFEVVWS